MTSFKKRDAGKKAGQRVHDTEPLADSPCVAEQHCTGDYGCVPVEDFSCTAPDYECGPDYSCTAPDYECGSSYLCSGDYSL